MFGVDPAHVETSPQRVAVGMIGGKASRHLRSLGNGAVAGDQDIDVPGSFTQPVECLLVEPDALSAAVFRARSRASLATWTPPAVA